MAQTVADLVVKISVQFKEATRSINNFSKDIGGLKGTLNNLSYAAYKAWSKIGDAAIGALKSISKASTDFESGLAQLGNASGKTVSQLGDVGRAAQDLGAKFGTSSNEVVKALKEFVRLGYSTEQALSAMPTLLKFSAANFADLGTTIKLTESIMTDFRKGLSDLPSITDTMTAAINRGQLSATDLTASFKKAGPAAAAAKASIADVAAATSILARAGFKGSEAGQALNAIFGRINSGSKPVIKAFKEIGIQTKDSAGNLKPFGQLMTEIEGKFGKLTDSQRLNFATVVAGTQHQAKFLQLIGKTPGEFAKLSKSLTENAGITDKFFKGIDETAQQSLNRLSASFENFKQNLGGSLGPALKVVSDALTGLLNAFNSLPAAAQGTIAVMAALGVAAVGLLAAVATLGPAFASLAGAWTTISTSSAVAPILSAAATAAGALGTAFATLATTIGVTVGVLAGIIAAVVAVGVLIYVFWDEIVAGAKMAWEGIKLAFSTVVEYWTSIWTSVKDSAVAAWEGIKSFFSDIWNAIVAVAHSIIDPIVQFFADIWQAIYDDNKETWDSIGEDLKVIWNALIDLAHSIIDPIVQFFSDIWDSVWEGAKAAWEGIKSFFQAIWDGIVAIGTAIFNAYVAFFKAVWDRIKGPLIAAWNYIKNFLTTTWNGLKDIATRIWDTLVDFFKNLWTRIKEVFSEMVTGALKWGENLIKGFADGIRAGVKWVTSAVKSVTGAIASKLKSNSPPKEGVLHTADKWMPNFMGMLAQGIESGIPKIQMAVGDVASTIDVLGDQSPGSNMTVNVYPRQSNLDSRGLTRELQRVSWLNGGAF